MDEKLITRLHQQCEVRSLVLSADQETMLLRYLDCILEWRQHLNLTGLQTAERIVDVLLLGSLDFFQQELFSVATRVLDLGTGAGVPGIPLAIGAPNLHITLLDRSEKKIAFVRRVVSRLALTNCQPYCGTAEALKTTLQSAPRFERVVSRGVGSVKHLLHLAAPLLCPGGKLILRKPVATAEIQEATAAINKGGWEGMQVWPLAWSGPQGWCLLVMTRG